MIERLIRRLHVFLLARSHVRLTVSMSAATLLIGAAELATGRQLSFSIFYLLPVVVTALYTSVGPAFVLAAIATATWAIAELGLGLGFYSNIFVPLWNASTQAVVFFLVAWLVAHLKWQSERDALTGLANRALFHQRLAAEIARAERYAHPLTLAYIDLDNFKQINDSFGHHVGDAVLRTVAEVLRQNTRRADVCARLGGDEFAALLPETDHEHAAEALQKLHEKLLGAMRGQHGHTIGCSIGAITIPAHAHVDPDFAVTAADTLMYQAKKGGKGKVRVASWPVPAEGGSAPGNHVGL